MAETAQRGVVNAKLEQGKKQTQFMQALVMNIVKIGQVRKKNNDEGEFPKVRERRWKQ